MKKIQIEIREQSDSDYSMPQKMRLRYKNDWSRAERDVQKIVRNHKTRQEAWRIFPKKKVHHAGGRNGYLGERVKILAIKKSVYDIAVKFRP